MKNLPFFACMQTSTKNENYIFASMHDYLKVNHGA